MASYACRILLVLAIVLLAGAGTASIATQAVVKQASPSLSADNLIASMEALLAAAKAKEAAHPRFARADALLTLLKVHSSLTKPDAAPPLEPLFAGLENFITNDPVGSVMAQLFAKVPAFPDPLLAGARDVKPGKYGEGRTGRAGGLDAGLSVARFGPCILQGAGEVAGAYANGIRVAPTGLDVGAAGAEVAPKLIDVSPKIIEVHPKGLDASPAEINVSPTLIQIAPGFNAARPGTIQNALISAVGGLADSMAGAGGGSAAAGAAGSGPGIAVTGGSDAAGAAGGGPGIALPSL